MGFLALVGYLGIGVGPGVAVLLQLRRRPVLVLLALGSCFVWLTALLAWSALWRPFTPLPAGGAAGATALVASVGAEEALRPVLWRAAYKRVERAVGRAAGVGRLRAVDKAGMAVAVGLGQGFAHSILFFLSTVSLSAGSAVYYAPRCPQMNLFLVSALSSLAFLLLHTFGTYVSFTGFDMHAGSVGGRDQLLCKAWTPALHLAMALTTLLNLVDGGCRATVWLLLLGAAATLALAGQISFGFGPG